MSKSCSSMPLNGPVVVTLRKESAKLCPAWPATYHSACAGIATKDKTDRKKRLRKKSLTFSAAHWHIMLGRLFSAFRGLLSLRCDRKEKSRHLLTPSLLRFRHDGAYGDAGEPAKGSMAVSLNHCRLLHSSSKPTRVNPSRWGRNAVVPNSWKAWSQEVWKQRRSSTTGQPVGRQTIRWLVKNEGMRTRKESASVRAIHSDRIPLSICDGRETRLAHLGAPR